MTPLFGPGWGNYALEGLVEVSAPPAPPLLPQTPGWLVLLAVLVYLLAAALWRRWCAWRHDRYRRAALAALTPLRERIAAGDTAALRELAPLLRRTLLAVLPREDIASASGEHLQSQLDRLAPGLPPLPLATIERLAYQPVGTADTLAGVDAAGALARWLAEHRRPDA